MLKSYNTENRDARESERDHAEKPLLMQCPDKMPTRKRHSL